ncbi:MAG TPA: hypothetical protein VMR34_03075 [Candidatus Saccharimonadales bacterium]|nr:hypothetical protein [Candidatus Saccharimonadales bacterium]
MASPEQPRLIVPIQGLHVRQALALARPNQDGFRKDEMEWMERHSTLMWVHFKELFEASIRVNGLEDSEARFAGDTLGHRAVRLCTGGGPDYDSVRDNFHHNLELDKRHVDMTDEPWNSEEILKRIFPDSDLTAALMEIRHGTARDAAAITSGFMCLAEVPAPVSANGT